MGKPFKVWSMEEAPERFRQAFPGDYRWLLFSPDGARVEDRKDLISAMSSDLPAKSAPGRFGKFPGIFYAIR